MGFGCEAGRESGCCLGQWKGGLVDPSGTLASPDVIFLNPFSPTGLVLWAVLPYSPYDFPPPLLVFSHSIFGKGLVLHSPQQSSSLPCLSTPKASGVKNFIWKAWSLKSRAVNHTPGLASTDRWGREEAGLCHGGQEWVQERGQVAQVLIWVWPWTSQYITSLCASGFLLLNAVIPALASSWGSCKDSSDAWYQSKRNHREEIPVSNSRRCGCTRVSHGSSGMETICQTNDIPPHTGWSPLPTLS